MISRRQKGEADVWQRRFWEHLIRDERDFSNHVEYIHYNPVKHGLVKSSGGMEIFQLYEICPGWYI